MKAIARLLMISMVPVLAACSAESSEGGSRGDAAAGPGAGGTSAPEQGVAPDAGSSPTFRATVAGAVDWTVEAGNAISGAKYGRYHINLAAETQPVILIAFGRDDTSTPGPGKYSLDSGGFSGTLEIYGDPQREFHIDSGELEITGARGDVLTGSFSFVARELGGDAQVTAEGTFQTRASD